MKPIQDTERFTLSKIISDDLKEYIIQNKLTTGDRLPSERELAANMDVSRVIIREALRSLEATGLVTIKQGEGAFVNTDDPQVIFQHLLHFWKMNNEKTEELLELRFLLEKAAIEQICQYPNAEQFEQLETLIQKMEQTEDPNDFQQYDAAFHTGLIEATQNSLFIQLADTIVKYFAEAPAIPFTQEEKNVTVKEHAVILQALKTGKLNQALTTLEKHLQRPRK